MKKVVGWTGRYILPVFLLLGALYGARRLVASRPEAMRQEAQDRVTPVDFVHPVRTNHIVRVEAMGHVVPASSIEVRAQVGGRLVALHPDFELGGRIPAGEVLASIEREDYEAVLAEAESAYAQSVLAEALELQRQAIAKEELAQEGTVLPDGLGRAIALREPQVEAAKRSRAAAAAAVERARRNLERTEVRLPFEALVLHKNVDAGSVLAPQASLGEVAAIDRFHIEAVLAQTLFRWLPSFDREGRFEGRPATEIGIAQGSETVWRVGHLSRLVGDMRGNMARVLVVVEEPLAAGETPILLGSYVTLRIPGVTLEGIWAIPRRALREDGSVLVAGEGERLVIRAPEVIRTTREYAFFHDGFEESDRVIITAVSAAVPDMQVRIMSDAEGDDE